MTTGMFGYSGIRPSMFQKYFDDIYDKCRDFKIPIECFHTETGPGVYEAALEYCDTLELADRAHLFKYLVKKIALGHGVIPCFMAKPYVDQPGCSGHLHFSLQDESGNNLFYDDNHKDKISSCLKSFLAGVMEGLPSIMALLAPTVNRYYELTIVTNGLMQHIGPQSQFRMVLRAEALLSESSHLQFVLQRRLALKYVSQVLM
jgi:glutamine synthetase